MGAPDIFLRKRRDFIAIVIVSLLIYTVASVSAYDNIGSLPTPGTVGLLMGPVVTGTTQNATVIRFLADQPCIPSIRYASDILFSATGTYDHDVPGILNGTSHAIFLTGLEPAARYHYLINGCGFDGRDRTFVTLPETGSCTFIVYGDTREQAPIYTQTDRHKLVADRISQEPGIAFVINSGDLVTDSTDTAEWARFLNATEKLRSTTTYVAVPGNHDTNRHIFQDLFGTDGPFSFNCGSTQIIILDSTDLSIKTPKEQALWLSTVMDPAKDAGIVVLHHPPFSSDANHYGGWANLQDTLVPVFQESGVRVVFSGHVHVFEQVEQDGITYITEARGGAPTYALNTTRIPGSVRSYENTLGYSRVSVMPDKSVIVDVIRVADISPDLRSVTKINPAGAIDARIIIPTSRYKSHFPSVTDLVCLPLSPGHAGNIEGARYGVCRYF